MAEGGILEGVLGVEAEPDEAESTLGGGDAAAVALALAEARQDPRFAERAAAFLDKQSRFIEVQMEHLHEQKAVQLSHQKLRRLSDRLKVGLQLFTVLVLSVLGFGLLVMIRDAVTSNSVVVEPFDTPAALAPRGLTGKVVAGGLLDELTQLQVATRSSAAKRNLSNAWTGDIKVEVPETGVSIGEVDNLLKKRFGHDLHIDGDLVQTDAGGLALTVRGDRISPKTFAGAAGDLEKLTTQAAEYVYGQAEPTLYAGYLVNAGRNAEAVAFSKAAYLTAARSEQPYLLNQWANALLNVGGSHEQALVLYRGALKLKPDYWIAYSNLMNSTWGLGDEEGSWRTGEVMRKAAGGRPGRAPENMYQNQDILTWNLLAWRAATEADARANRGLGTQLALDGPAIADIDARLHDPAAAEFQLQTIPGDSNDPATTAYVHFVQGVLAREAGDTRKAVAEMEAFGEAYKDPVVSSNYPGYTCWIAPAEEAAGRSDKADAVLKAGGRYVDCYRFRGDILDHRGDWAAAQKAYASAVAIAPDLPAGYYSWGVALARHGDPAGALSKLAEASRRGPHWADPLKASGDVLAAQGRWREALAKYDTALRYAPAWAALRQARGAVSRRAQADS